MIKENYWHIELTDGRIFPFQWKAYDDGNPLEKKHFLHDDNKHFIMDISELREEFSIYEGENSFVLVPKDKVKRVFYRG